MAKLPHMPFYVGDWMKDPGLRACSLAARGLLMDLLCLMWECDPRGELRLNGHPVPDDDIPAMVGASKQDVDFARVLLERNGVVSRTSDGAIYSRRMVREEDIRQKRALAGQKGGLSRSKRASKSQAKRKQNSDNDNDNTLRNYEEKSINGKPKNEIWDAVAAIWYPSGVPPSERSRVGRVVRDMKSLSATPEQIRERYAAAKVAWPEVKVIGPEAVVKHWGSLVVSPSGKSPKTLAQERIWAEEAAERRAEEAAFRAEQAAKKS